MLASELALLSRNVEAAGSGARGGVSHSFAICGASESWPDGSWGQLGVTQGDVLQPSWQPESSGCLKEAVQQVWEVHTQRATG